MLAMVWTFIFRKKKLRNVICRKNLNGLSVELCIFAKKSNTPKMMISESGKERFFENLDIFYISHRENRQYFMKIS